MKQEVAAAETSVAGNSCGVCPIQTGDRVVKLLTSGAWNPYGVWFTDADVRQIPVFSGDARNTRVSVEQFDPTKRYIIYTRVCDGLRTYGERILKEVT